MSLSSTTSDGRAFPGGRTPSGEGTPEGGATLALRREESGAVAVVVAGDWLMRRRPPGFDVVERELRQGVLPRRMEFDLARVGQWDSALVSLVLRCRELCKQRGIEFGGENLPEGLDKLIRLATAVAEVKEAHGEAVRHSLLHRLGEAGLRAWAGARETLAFLGECVLALFRVFRGTAQYRWSDAWLVIQQCGPEAIGVVALINFLVGLILAFVGSVQLSRFGASMYVADLVAIGTVREMGCIMTGVILCGRTGAAFAAQLGAMKVNEEIDAFKTFGISPIEFLVVPRILALVLMMPLLCVFADAIAIAGGYFAAVSMLDVTSTEYLRRTAEAIVLRSFLLGIVKGAFFGMIVAVAGCMRGMQCGTNAAAVGHATTSSVVTGITSIVAADGIFAVLCNALKI